MAQQVIINARLKKKKADGVGFSIVFKLRKIFQRNAFMFKIQFAVVVVVVVDDAVLSVVVFYTVTVAVITFLFFTYNNYIPEENNILNSRGLECLHKIYSKKRE